jgi:hypothetical protein
MQIYDRQAKKKKHCTAYETDGYILIACEFQPRCAHLSFWAHQTHDGMLTRMFKGSLYEIFFRFFFTNQFPPGP